MLRRAFLSVLAGLPFAGLFVAPKQELTPLPKLMHKLMQKQKAQARKAPTSADIAEMVEMTHGPPSQWK